MQRVNVFLAMKGSLGKFTLNNKCFLLEFLTLIIKFILKNVRSSDILITV